MLPPTEPIASRRAALALSVVALALASCKSPPKPPPPPPPTAVQAAIVAGPEVNPDRGGRPSPIVLKVFELKSLAAFERADFFSLFDKDRDTLGAELLAREEFSLRPGGRDALAREVQADTRFIGVVAGFRDLERSTWRASIALPRHQLTAFSIRLDRHAVSIVAQ